METRTSESLTEKLQPFVYEDRTAAGQLHGEMPLRLCMPGKRHIDVVPICHA